MNKIFLLVLTLMLIFAGCTGQYSFEENEFDNEVNLDGQVDTGDEVISGNVQVEETEDGIRVEGEINRNVKEPNNYQGSAISIERLETDGTVYIKNILDNQVEITVSIPDVFCSDSSKGLIESKSVGSVKLEGCKLISGNDYSVVVVTNDGVYQATMIARGENPDYQLKCSDSDGGNDIYTKGKIEYTTNGYLNSEEDKCWGTNGQILLEYFCEGEEFSFDSFVDCKYGCSNGACLKEKPQCYDSDGGLKLFDKGYATIDNGLTKIYDQCGVEQGYEDENSVLEAFCQDYELEVIFSPCEYGCSNGVCLDKINSSDKNYLSAKYDSQKGTVELNWNSYDDKNNFKYYKVVHSTSNPNLKYPEDGYITYITDISKTNYIDTREIPQGVNYYRITTVLNDGNKLHGDVKKIEVNEDADDESVRISLGDGEQLNFLLEGLTKSVQILDISEYKVKFLLNGKTYEVDLYDNMELADGVYVLVNDIVLSRRDSVKSYVEFLFTNYKLELDQSLMECHDLYDSQGIFTFFDNKPKYEYDYCKDSTKLVEYKCGYDENLDFSTSIVSCDYKCQDSKCVPKPCENIYDESMYVSYYQSEVINSSSGVFEVVLESVTEDKALFTINGETQSIDLCDSEKVAGLDIQLISTSEENNSVRIGYNIEEVKNYVQTDFFDFWEDRSSHNYVVNGSYFEGAYLCKGSEKINSVTTPTTGADRTLRLSNCAHGEGQVSLDLEVLENSEFIKLEIQGSTGNEDIGIYLDGHYIGNFVLANPCEVYDIVFDDNLGLSADGKVNLLITDNVPNSCKGDPQLTYVKAYSK